MTTWDEYAAQLADHYSDQIDFLYDQGHDNVTIEWRGGPCTAIVADLGPDDHIVATNNEDGSALAGPDEPQSNWVIGVYTNEDNGEPLALFEAADFETAYRSQPKVIAMGNRP